jgi:hypothetical protein
MHPAFVTAIAAAQQQDKLARAAAARQARSVRQARSALSARWTRQARSARRGSQPEPSPRPAVRRPHGPAAPSTHARQKAGA